MLTKTLYPWIDLIDHLVSNHGYRKYGPGHRAFNDFPIQVNFDRSRDEENDDLWNRITSEMKIEWPENLEFLSEIMSIVEEGIRSKRIMDASLDSSATPIFQQDHLFEQFTGTLLKNKNVEKYEYPKDSLGYDRKITGNRSWLNEDSKNAILERPERQPLIKEWTKHLVKVRVRNNDGLRLRGRFHARFRGRFSALFRELFRALFRAVVRTLFKVFNEPIYEDLS